MKNIYETDNIILAHELTIDPDVCLDKNPEYDDNGRLINSTIREFFNDFCNFGFHPDNIDDTFFLIDDVGMMRTINLLDLYKNKFITDFDTNLTVFACAVDSNHIEVDWDDLEKIEEKYGVTQIVWGDSLVWNFGTILPRQQFSSGPIMQQSLMFCCEIGLEKKSDYTDYITTIA